ncbi:hypothetical protein ABXV19_11220 [Pseudomonas alkylphenolica]|uniref:hypothetical protein n=1 Tax=Pseudomonas alkylphenolica TaxID=237609 RepID=UPI000FA54F89
MISEDDLIEEFGSVRRVDKNIFSFHDEMQSYAYRYWLKSYLGCDLIAVSEVEVGDALPLSVIMGAPKCLAENKPTIYKLAEGQSIFTHAIAVPSNYHGYLKGVDCVNRDDLFLCIPIHRCEFSGDESPEEFKELRLNFIPTLDWKRDKHPKLRVYFDNPKTGGGTDEAGVLFKLPVLLQEIENLNGVGEGFIEVTNWSGGVIEIISPESGKYILITNRQDEELLGEDILERVKSFAVFE